MQIRLTQGDLELAVADYIVKMGITRPIGEINFAATRGEAGIITEVELYDTPSAAPTGPVARTPTAAPEQEKSEAKPAQETTEAAPAEVVAAQANGKAAPEASTGVKAKSLFGG